MATLAEPASGPEPTLGRDDRFFLTMAVVMAMTIVAGFTLHLAMGRSTFGAPLLVHVHAVVFFGWVVLYVLQNLFVYRGVMGLHRLLGWTASVWAAVMVVVGIYTTMTMVRHGTAPFFFRPAYFLVMNSVAVLSFAGLTAAAILLRRQTDWHRRLHYCGMAVLSAPAFGRLLPSPLMIPWAGWGIFAATMIFPLVGILADLKRRGTVHPAWWWGAGVMLATQVTIVLLVDTGPGAALYSVVTQGYPGAAIPPLDYPPFPPIP